MDFRGDNRIKHKVNFERKTYMECIFCGVESNTREHAPSKVFISEPLPTDLPTVPSCRKCNNSYASDELYTAVLIKLLRKRYDNYELTAVDLKRLNTKEGQDAFQFIENYGDKLGYIDNKRLERVLIKLARSHAVYELFTCYEYNSSDPKYDINLFYDYKPFMEESIKEEIDSIVLMNDKILPEMGANLYQRIYCAEPISPSLNNNGKDSIISFLLWNEINDGEYRYTSYIEDGKYVVKIVIQDFVYAKIIFSDL